MPTLRDLLIASILRASGAFNCRGDTPAFVALQRSSFPDCTLAFGAVVPSHRRSWVASRRQHVSVGLVPLSLGVVLGVLLANRGVHCALRSSSLGVILGASSSSSSRGARASALAPLIRRGLTPSRSVAVQAADDRLGPKVAFVIGGPGSGKGTQCERIAAEFGFIHLSAGDLLRAERGRKGSTLGEVIDSAMKAGGTVPSHVIAELLEQAMRERGWSSSKFLVDGYPRSVDQLVGWDSVLSKRVRIMFCLSLEVSEEVMRERLMKRSLTSGRSDDNMETIAKRFVTFQAETTPLLAHFESKGLLRRVNGGQSVQDVSADVRKLFHDVDRDA